MILLTYIPYRHILSKVQLCDLVGLDFFALHFSTFAIVLDHFMYLVDIGY